ncbi:MAG: alpha/beta hydrolase [Chloroflexota bacterium]
MRRRFLVLTGAVAVGLVLGLTLSVAGAGGWDLWLSQRGVVATYGDLGRAVPALDGRRLYLDCRGEGAPTVVLEAGMGMDARSWGAVFPALADVTRTCAYSRANRWGSDTRGPHTIGAAAADLRAALAAAGEDPPFILVGHSLGDVYVRAFAGPYRDDVAGLVLVDPFGPDAFRRLIALAPSGLAARWQANLDGNIAAVTATEGLDWPASERELAAVDLGTLPVEIVVVRQPFDVDPFVPDADRKRLAAVWEAGLEAVSGATRVTFAAGSSHMIQWDRPDLVIEATERLVQGTRKGRVGLGRRTAAVEDQPGAAAHAAAATMTVAWMAT